VFGFVLFFDTFLGLGGGLCVVLCVFGWGVYWLLLFVVG